MNELAASLQQSAWRFKYADLTKANCQNFVKSLRYPAPKIRGSIKLTQAFCWCSPQQGGMVVGCHTMIIQQSITPMRLSIGCLWQALRNETRLKQTSHTHPISSLAPEQGKECPTSSILWKAHLSSFHSFSQHKKTWTDKFIPMFVLSSRAKSLSKMVQLLA